MQQPFQPYHTLANRTFIGLLIAQFLAAFNDQCIHAAAMFYAIRTNTLTEAQAITLMPILFYLPWALFCTIAGYLADRFSKLYSLIFWKIAEVGITFLALFGFWLGTGQDNQWGPYLVLSTVFLMGTHSAFFVPAKYGVMPEILRASLLSRANGFLEGSSFLAIIAGTVSGGVMSFYFAGQEYFIGLILVGLATIGMVASFMIQWMPAANPRRPFPWNLFKPLWQNLRTVLRSQPLALAALGIAFFTFMVAFMRSTVYMHGEAHHWTELKTSIIVATVGLGIGLGSYLAGLFSGHKVELGLVPLGTVGMILATLAAGLAITWLAGLITSIVLIGLFAGFYIVPLYALLQHRSPKASKGDMIATSNFLNVTGAITASLLFFGLEYATKQVGLAEAVPQTPVAQGRLRLLQFADGRPAGFKVELADGTVYEEWAFRDTSNGRGLFRRLQENNGRRIVIEAKKKGWFQRLEEGDEVAISRYRLAGRVHYEIRLASDPLEPAYNMEMVPRFLFIGASVMTLIILVLLCRQLPDFFVRSLLWLHSYGRYHIKVYGIVNLPVEAAAILATNCHRFRNSMHVLASTDRTVRFILLEEEHDESRTPLLRYMASQTGMIVLEAGKVTSADVDTAAAAAIQSLRNEDLVALTADGVTPDPVFERLLNRIETVVPAPIVPVFCGTWAAEESGSTSGRSGPRRVFVVIGEALPPHTPPQEIRQALAHLEQWLRDTVVERTSGISEALPAVAAASPSKQAVLPPEPPSAE